MLFINDLREIIEKYATQAILVYRPLTGLAQ